MLQINKKVYSLTIHLKTHSTANLANTVIRSRQFFLAVSSFAASLRKAYSIGPSVILSL